MTAGTRSALLALALLAAACGGSGTRGTPDGGPADGAPPPDGATGDGGADGGADGGGGDADGGLDGGLPREDGGGTPGDGGLDGGDERPPRECAAMEGCFDGTDDDCDGMVDEGCPCVPGETQSCFRGDPRGRGVGRCEDGAQVCTGTFEFGMWEACSGDVVEIEEVCDVAGVDEDCDGASNEGCECVDGDPPIACGSDIGQCQMGVQECVGGRRTACQGAVPPGVEVCDGVDNDCDGSVDEDIRRACGDDTGACRPGFESCVGGVWGLCEGGNLPSTETCDGLDNDCDGMTDEAVQRNCGVDLGRCIAGIEMCADGAFGTCEGRIDPVAETCNGVDDDCDGMTDEALTRACGVTDLGVCERGTETCVDNSWGACVGAVLPGTETCDGSLDEDCDGTVDEGCACTDGATRPCGTDTGACVAGTETCFEGAWGACDGRVAPVPESCDGLDNDCDGATDESLTRACGDTDLGICQRGTETCSAGAYGACVGVVLPATEVCDGALDEDCDGSVDEGCDCVDGATRGCGTDRGECVAGTETCAGGAWGACEGRVLGTVETCDGLDNDCDGLSDETLARACGTNTGECVAGVQTCGAGDWGSCMGEVVPGTEVCDGSLDEDCDGAVDEGCGCVNGTVRSCGIDTGACELGSQTCVGGAWQACMGGTGPSPEICDGTIDQDCDGKVDNGCDCTNGETRSCGTDVGACTFGSQQCVDGTWDATCTGGTGPRGETCNGADDDCDGSTDEMLSRICGSSTGVCATGVEACTGGAWSGVCAGEVGPSPEVCEGSLDEDCDGTVDNGCGCTNGQTRACGDDTGACVAGTETCTDGDWPGVCAGEVGPTGEICNNLDDDCDGVIDDGVTRTCGTDQGACVAGTETCTNGSWGSCAGEVGPALEVCDAAGADEDCDGEANEGCQCSVGQFRNCGTNTGECSRGRETCQADGTWGACDGVGPTAEVCDGLDNDCDGTADNGGVCQPPTVMCPGAMSTDVGTTLDLVGSGSDPDGGSVTFAWTVSTAPTGSGADPTPAGAAATTFTPDEAGSYTLQLCATDDESVTRCCTTSVSAAATCTPPATPTITSCGISWDRRPLVEFGALPSGVTYELFADGSPYATITSAGQNYHRPAPGEELGSGGPPSAPQTVSIYARACRASDATCCATSGAIEVDLIETCTTPIPATSANIVFSEYIPDGQGPGGEEGEAIELTNLSHCPVSLDGLHFEYCNDTCSAGSVRYMNFGPDEIIPPRGVYVAVRELGATTCTYPFLGPEDPGLFGLKISALAMMGSSLSSGWFLNSGGGMLRIAEGAFTALNAGATVEIIDPYRSVGAASACHSIGFDAIDQCGDIAASSTPTTELDPNQLGRLWAPCDAVVAPNPPGCM